MPNQENSHPNHLDRNAAILWARDLLNRDDWGVLSFSESRLAADKISAAFLTRDGVTCLEQDPLIDCTDFSARLQDMTGGKEIVCWDVEVTRRCLSAVLTAAGLNPLAVPAFLSAQEQYSRFVGERQGESYILQGLPGRLSKAPVLDATVFSRSVLEVIFLMAGSNQVMDAAAPANPGWSAAFYKPKSTPADKLKSIFGLK